MIVRLLAVILAMATGVLAERPSDGLTASGVREFSAAFQAWDSSGFTKPITTFSKATASDPGSAAAFYWKGVACFHQMLWARNPHSGKADEKAAEAAAGEAMKALEAALALEPDHAECHALVGTLYGMKIKGSMIAAIRYGPRIQEHQKKALASGSTNPRVRYLLGAALFHTAKDVSGHLEALSNLLAAEKLFAHEAKLAAKPLAPRWGYSSCLDFIGRTYETMGKKKEALIYYRKALAMHPSDHAAAAAVKRLGGK